MIDPCLYGEHLVAILKDEKTALVKTDPPIQDFTRASQSFLAVSSKKASIKLPLNDQLDSIIGLLALVLFVPERTVIAWDIKSLITYLRFQGKSECFDTLNLDRVIDLKLCEAFLGAEKQAPLTWAEAVQRLKSCAASPVAWRTHKKIHLPLATKVVPAMEAWGVVDDCRKKTLYPSYTIEGQVQGRMSCHVPFDRCINPHNLDGDQKAVVKPRSPHAYFVQLDYRAMEVAVLQWLSKDPVLEAIVSDPSKDVYEEVFKTVTDAGECGKEERDLAKSFFLPVFFGMQPYALSQRIGVEQGLAQQIIDLIGQKFPTAWRWVQDRHEEAKENGRVTDFFGRVREVHESYLARHFAIAAPAASICLERLVRLHDALPADETKLIFSIHDGYVLATSRPCLTDAVNTSRSILEGDIPMCPGLKLRTSCEAGKNLAKMVRLY